MSSKKTVIRRHLRRQPRATTNNLVDLYYFIKEHEADVRDLIEQEEQEKKKAEDKNKQPDSFFTKKFGFGQLLFWQLITGPFFGLLWFKILGPYFH